MRRLAVLSSIVVVACTAIVLGQRPAGTQTDIGPTPVLPPPDPASSAMNFVTSVDWPPGATPKAPDGFQVAVFGEALNHPRWLYVLPNGDVLVAQASTLPKAPTTEEERQGEEGQRRSRAVIVPSANRITLLRDADGDGTVDERSVFLDGLNQPFGMALVGSTLFVGSTDGISAYPYEAGATQIRAAGKKILNLPAGGYNNHWTRNVVANVAGSKLYVSVGSASNAAELGLAEEARRANILEINLDGSGERVFASGLRNPNGMDWETSTGALWTVVNERDNLGDDLVPDYLTRVQDGGFYGWPFSYYGSHVDARVTPQRPELVAKAIVPDYAVGAHTASLGLTFYRADAFPARYKGGAFIGQHGSWNRSQFSGYKVLFVPFQNGKPSGMPEDFLTGFQSGTEAYGRPVGVTVDKTGALLVADDAGNRVWRVVARTTTR